MTFRERYLLGEADFDEIFDLTDEWNMSEETCTLREYLGLTIEEEEIWIEESDDALEQLMLQEKNRKIFFTDLDDTLLNSEKKISQKTGDTLRKVLDKGNIIAITTGRAFPGAMKMVKSLGLNRPGCYVISYNGVQIFDLEEKKMLREDYIPLDLVKQCFSYAQEFGIHIQTYSEQNVLVQKECQEVQAYCKIQNLDYDVVKDVTTVLKKGAPKLLAISNDPETLNRFKEFMTDKVGEQLDIFRSSAAYLEFVPKNINKGDAVRFLCRYLCIPIERSVSAGDQENDLEMIEAAGVGCAMINGVDSLKEKADYVTKADQNHDGVVEILEKFVLNKE